MQILLFIPILLIVLVYSFAFQYIANATLFSPGASTFSNAHFGSAPSSSPILLSMLQCSGSESRLIDCQHLGVGQIPSSCRHDDDAGLRCFTGKLFICLLMKPLEDKIKDDFCIYLKKSFKVYSNRALYPYHLPAEISRLELLALRATVRVRAK